MQHCGISQRGVMAPCNWVTSLCSVLLFISSAALKPNKAAPICHIHHDQLPVFTSKVWHNVHHFNCSVSEGSKPSVIVLKMDGNIVRQAKGPVAWLEFTLDDAAIDDTSTISCETNVGKNNVSCQTSFAEPPHITTHQSIYEVYIGEALVVPCRSTGFPQPSLTWTKRDKELHKSALDPSITWRRSRGSTDLVIQAASMKHSGIYVCHAVNRVGEESHYAVVTVLYRPAPIPPRVHPLQPNKQIKEGSKAVLTCAVANAPKRYTALYWDHQGKRLKNTKRIQQNQRFAVKIDNNMNKKEHAMMSLTINHVTSKDAGIYTCGTVTQVGRDENHVLLEIEG